MVSIKTSLTTALVLAMLAGTAHAAALIDAIRSGDAAKAESLVKHHKADVNETSANGTTALHWAVFKGDNDLVKRLIKEGAKVNTKNDFGSSPMSEAAVRGDADLIKMLLKAGADPESPNADGQTALMILSRSNNVKAAEELIKAGANVNAREKWRDQTAVIWAAAQSQPEMLALLIKHGAKVNVRSRPNDWKRMISEERRYQWRPAGGLTALVYAAREGCQACVKELLDAGADIDDADDGGTTALLTAVINKHFDTAKYLVERGANVNKWSLRGENPLYSAVDMNTLPHGGYPDRPTTDKTSALEMEKILLDAGANPNLQLKLQPIYRSLKDDRGADRMLNIGATPLLRAAKAFDVDSMKLLLAHGALPNLPNRDGTTPLMAAAGLGSNSIDTRGDFTVPDVAERSKAAIKVMLEHGGKINQRDHHGRTALHGAAGWGWNAAVAFLASQGADLTAKDDDGLTPYDNAMGKRVSFGGRGVTGDVHKDTAELIKKLMADNKGKPGV